MFKKVSLMFGAVAVVSSTVFASDTALLEKARELLSHYQLRYLPLKQTPQHLRR